MTLAARNLSVAIDGTRILRDLSVEVSPGEVVTVVGPSGTGKTTLLRHLALFRPPDSGTVAWDGRDAWELSDADRLALRRRVSMTFQEPSLFDAPVYRNVTYGRRVRRSWRDRLRREVERLVRSPTPDRADEALEAVGLLGKAERNALSLSGGEAQRIAFARALAVDPDVMLLDEPTSNLDPRNTAVIEEAILTARTRGVGVLVATHDMHQAERISDRVAVVLGGELVEVGPAERIFESPSDPRTERFIDGELVFDTETMPDAEAVSDAETIAGTNDG